MAKTTPAKNTPSRAAPAGRAQSSAPATTTAPKAGKELAVVDDDMRKLMEADSGVGISTDASDNIVPLIYVLQAQSPQCLSQKQECIKPGINNNKTAVAGNIWPRGSKILIDGEEQGMLVQLCHFRKAWVEWRPDRGGYVGEHASKPDAAEWVEDPKTEKGHWELPNGNAIVETRYHTVLVHDEVFGGQPAPFVIPMSSTNHTPAKQWMTDIGRKRVPGTDKRASLWAYMWRMRTVPKSNDSGDWYGWSIEDGGEGGVEMLCTDPAAYRLARQIHEDFEKGVRRADTPDDNDGDAGGTGAGASRDEDDKNI